MSELRSEADLLSLTLAEFQRSVTYAYREKVADHFALNVNKYTAGLLQSRGFDKDSRWGEIDLLRRQGLVDLGAQLTEQQAAEVRAYFAGLPCFNSHLPAQSDRVPRSLSEISRAGGHASYAIADVVDAPYLLELANSPFMLSIAEGYLGCTPTLYSMNAFWSFPGTTEPTLGLQTFHRDFDDFRFCTLFVFLTDTDATDGAHTYIVETHRYGTFKTLVGRLALSSSDPAYADMLESLDEADLFSSSNLDLDDACDQLLAPAFRSVHGSAGSAVIEDTYGLHRGSIPRTPRLLFWARYGLYQNSTWFNDQFGEVRASSTNGRVPSTAYHRYVNRLLVPGWRA